MTKKAVLYARVSISSEESVSVSRQLAVGRKYAEARDWEVVGEFVDEGVSATHNKPEDRTGWRAVMASAGWYDAVIVWKIDRLARRVMDFLRADEALRARGAAIVCVEQSLDMTTGEGRAFAQMLAVFGEMEAAAISSRVTAARSHIIRSGRVAGGPQPYGWRSVPNPDGPGLVLDQDPERIEWIRGMATRALRGNNVHSIARWLDEEGAPLPRGAIRLPTSRRWSYTTVHSLLSNPILAGMILYNPRAGARSATRDVLRDAQGAPLIREDLAVITVEERKELVGRLEKKAHHAAIGRGLRATTSPILAGLVYCGACNRKLPMRRGTAQGRAVMKCPRCTMLISTRLLASYLERRLIAERGPLPMYRRAHTVPGNRSASSTLQKIEKDLRSAALALIEDGADTQALGHRITGLKSARTIARRAAGALPVEVLIELGLSVEDIWRRCSTDDQRREVLSGQIERLTIYRGNYGGRNLDRSRVDLTWRTDARQVAPEGVAESEPHETYSEPAEWISLEEAVKLVGCSMTVIRNAAERGEIEKRKTHRVHPSLSAISVARFADARSETATS